MFLCVFQCFSGCIEREESLGVGAALSVGGEEERRWMEKRGGRPLHGFLDGGVEWGGG